MFILDNLSHSMLFSPKTSETSDSQKYTSFYCNISIFFIFTFHFELTYFKVTYSIDKKIQILACFIRVVSAVICVQYETLMVVSDQIKMKQKVL